MVFIAYHTEEAKNSVLGAKTAKKLADRRGVCWQSSAKKSVVGGTHSLTLVLFKAYPTAYIFTRTLLGQLGLSLKLISIQLLWAVNMLCVQICMKRKSDGSVGSSDGSS